MGKPLSSDTQNHNIDYLLINTYSQYCDSMCLNIMALPMKGLTKVKI